MRRSPLACVLLSALALALGLRPASAEDAKPEPLTPETAAARVQAAAAADDADALRRLAQRVDPDPWLTTRELLYAGQYDAAERFVREVPDALRGKLADEVTAWRDHPESPALRKAHMEAVGQIRAKRPDAALRALEGVEPGLPSSVVLHADLRGRIRMVQGNREGLATAMEETAIRAAELGWISRVAFLYFNAGRVAHRERDYKEAVRLLEAAWKAAQVGTPYGTHGTYLYGLALAQTRAGMRPQARETLRAAIEVYRELGALRSEARMLNQLGLVCTNLGLYEEAEEAHRRSLAIHEAQGNKRTEAVERINLSRVLQRTGRLAEAERVLRPAFDLVKRPQDRAVRVAALRILGKLNYEQGRASLAIRMYRQALEVAKELRNKREIALALHALGQAYRYVGALDEAVKSLEEAIQIKIERGDSLGAGRSLSVLGVVHHTRKDYDAARAAFDLSIQYKRAKNDRPGLVSTLVNRGNMLAAAGKLDDAERDLSEALSLARKLGRPVSIANALVGLGRLDRERGDTKRAAERFEEAASIAKQAGDARSLLHAYKWLVDAASDADDTEGVLVATRRAMELVLTMQRGLSDEHALGFREQHISIVRFGMRAAEALGRPADAFYYAEAARADALLEIVGGSDLMDDDAFPQEARRSEQAARAAERRALQELTLAMGRGDTEAAARARAALAEARKQLADVAEAARAKSRETADVFYPRPMVMTDFQGSLGEGDAYVAYVLTPDLSFALVVTHKQARIVQLQPTEDLRSRIDAVRYDAPPALNKDGIAALAKAVVEPLGLPTGTRNILISPAGDLIGVPFCVLMPEHRITYVPSATTHTMLMKSCTRCGKGVLAVGNPKYPPGLTAGGIELKPLPHTVREVKQVGDVVLLGEDATPTGLKHALKRQKAWSAVHLACHAIMNPEEPQASALLLTPESNRGGRLRIPDVFRMKVPADLTVLSACESGVGESRTGEGLVGFTRAFMFAGSRRVIVSLWMVDDEATSALMKKFYELWQTPRDGKPTTTAEALYGAQVWMRSQDRWKHPYYWAAWSLWGVSE